MDDQELLKRQLGIIEYLADFKDVVYSINEEGQVPMHDDFFVAVFEVVDGYMWEADGIIEAIKSGEYSIKDLREWITDTRRGWLRTLNILMRVGRYLTKLDESFSEKYEKLQEAIHKFEGALEILENNLDKKGDE